MNTLNLKNEIMERLTASPCDCVYVKPLVDKYSQGVEMYERRELRGPFNSILQQLAKIGDIELDQMASQSVNTPIQANFFRTQLKQELV